MNKFHLLSIYFLAVGIFPSFLIKNRFLKFVLLFWNTLTLLFNLLWFILELYRLKQGLSVSYAKVEGGFLVNASLGVASIITISIVLGVRIWIIIHDVAEILQRSRSSLFKRIYLSFQKLSGNFDGKMTSCRCESSSLCFNFNEFILFSIILLSTARHLLFAYLRKILFYTDYVPVPNIWSLEIEFWLRYGKALFCDLSPVDSILLFCVFLLKLVGNSISYLNDKVEMHLMGLEQNHHFSSFHNRPNNRTKTFINAKTPKKKTIVLFQHLILMEYKSLNVFDVKKFSELYMDLVQTWEQVKASVVRLIFICFGMWMQNLSFNCFYSYTAAVDIGFFSLFAVTFHFIVITNVVKYICTAHAVHGMNYQSRRLNCLLLRFLASCSSPDDDEYNSGSLQGYERATKGQMKKDSFKPEDISLIAHLYDLNSKQKPLSLSESHTFNRKTVFPILGTVTTYLIVLLQFQLASNW
ncbi:unnamed protein product [Orchesella dallaii]|uniref:Gustatory receptor n=1 Tax=Orchesella dallaii TaxID=48710 RepID=A0ABP1R237_9HEXA